MYVKVKRKLWDPVIDRTHYTGERTELILDRKKASDLLRSDTAFANALEPGATSPIVLQLGGSDPRELGAARAPVRLPGDDALTDRRGDDDDDALRGSGETRAGIGSPVRGCDVF